MSWGVYNHIPQFYNKIMKDIKNMITEKESKSVETASFRKGSGDHIKQKYFDSFKNEFVELEFDVDDVINAVDTAKIPFIENTTWQSFRPWFDKLNVMWGVNIPTMATDGYNLYINPCFVWYDLLHNGDMSYVRNITAVLGHEMMHVFLNHRRRFENTGLSPEDHYRSNIAMDYEVNDTLVELGLLNKEIWEDIKGYYDTKYVNKTWEEIYPDVLQQQKEQQGKQGGPDGDPGGRQKQEPWGEDAKKGFNDIVKKIREYQGNGLTNDEIIEKIGEEISKL